MLLTLIAVAILELHAMSVCALQESEPPTIDHGAHFLQHVKKSPWSARKKTSIFENLHGGVDQPTVHGDPFTQLPPHLKNRDLAGEVLFQTLGLDPGDLSFLNQQERTELRAALKDAGVQLGDLVKLRVWMQSGSARPLDILARMDDPPGVHKRLQAAEAKAEKSDGGISAECAAAAFPASSASHRWERCPAVNLANIFHVSRAAQSQ